METTKLNSIQDFMAFLRMVEAKGGTIQLDAPNSGTARATPQLSREIVRLMYQAVNPTISSEEARRILRAETRSAEKLAVTYGMTMNSEGEFALREVLEKEQYYRNGRRKLLDNLAALTQDLEEKD